MKIKARFLVLIVLILLMSVSAGAALAQDDGGDDSGGDADGGRADSAVCNGDMEHPVIQGIADTYGASYEEVLGYFCDGFGLGEIMLAYETAEATGGSVADLLGQKGPGNGWGKIWKELGLIGNERDGGPPPWAGRGKPDWAGPHGNGGPPEDKGQGQGNGQNPNSNDNPGQGNGNGNGQGNGNGNGQGNGQGNSGGNDGGDDGGDTSGDDGGDDA